MSCSGKLEDVLDKTPVLSSSNYKQQYRKRKVGKRTFIKKDSNPEVSVYLYAALNHAVASIKVTSHHHS